MEQSTLKRARVGVAYTIASLALLGCGSLPPDASSSTTSTAQANVIVCNSGTTIDDREFYVLSAIRKKLADFPELATAIGPEPPTTCAEARVFADNFVRYEAAHPGFDSQQELGPAPPVSAIPRGRAPKLSVTKLLQGVDPGPDLGAYPHASVVRISTIPSPHTSVAGNGTNNTCSGTFIAKNWLVTAAHCLALTSPVSLPSSQVVAGDIYGDASWKVEWPDGSGTLSTSATLTSQAEDVLQHPDPRYMGTLPVASGDPGFSHFDFALLYFPEETYDGVLPPRADTGAAMRLSIVPPDPNGVMMAAGFGPGDSGGTTKLQRGDFQPPFFVSTTGDFFQKTVQTLTEPVLCRGDSGGPAYTMVDIGSITQPDDVPIEQAPTTVPVMFGVNSQVQRPPACFQTNPPSDDCPLPSSCAQQNGLEIWKRVDIDERAFMEERMGLWQYGPSFACREGHATGGSTNTFMECWGTPCESDGDCNQSNNEYCRRDSLALQNESCQICQGSCDCVVGQCVVGPPLSANQ